MSYSPIIVPRFGGLRLDADPGDLGMAGAVDLRNVEFDPNGTVRARPGFDRTDANTFAAAPTWLARFKADSSYVLVGGAAGGTTIRDYTSSFVRDWTATGTIGGVSAIPSHVVERGVASAIPETPQVIHTWPGSTYIAGVDGSGSRTGYDITYASPKFLGVMPDGRLIGMRSSVSAGATQQDSTVRFSDPIDFATWRADDYVQLNPADGEKIRMGVPWGNNFFVFKDTNFFVFYGNSVDSTGGAIFNYRTVDTGVGCGYDYAACAAQDGVYFVHQDGVYRTTGGTPELVSGALQMFFDERPTGFFTPTGPLTTPRIHAGDDRLYVWQQGATGMFVMDLRTRDWTYWVLNVAPYALLPLDTPREFIFADSTGRMHKFSPDFTDDDGTAISSYYHSGFVELAEGKESHVRDFDLSGSGTVTHQIASDYGSVDTGTSVTLGTAPAVALGFDTLDRMGRTMSFKVGATSGAWSLTRWMARVKGVRDWT